MKNLLSFILLSSLSIATSAIEPKGKAPNATQFAQEAVHKSVVKDFNKIIETLNNNSRQPLKLAEKNKNAKDRKALIKFIKENKIKAIPKLYREGAKVVAKHKNKKIEITPTALLNNQIKINDKEVKVRASQSFEEKIKTIEKVLTFNKSSFSPISFFIGNAYAEDKSINSFYGQQAILLTALLFYEELEDTGWDCDKDCEKDKYYKILGNIEDARLSCKSVQEDYAADHNKMEKVDFLNKYGTLNQILKSSNEDLNHVANFMNHLNNIYKISPQLRSKFKDKFSSKSLKATKCDELVHGMIYFKKKIYLSEFDEYDEPATEEEINDIKEELCDSVDDIQACLNNVFSDIMTINTGARGTQDQMEHIDNPFNVIKFNSVDK